MSDRDAAESPEDFVAMVDTLSDGWKSAMGVRFTRATTDEVVANLTIGPAHRQPYGIVHGGVHTGLVEAVASVGAGLAGLAHGRYAVGLENHTSFIRAVRDGVLRATGRPLVRGRQSQVWEVNIVDEGDRLVAAGRVRLLLVEKGSMLGGRNLELTSSE